MANNAVMRQITLTDQWQPLSPESVIGTFTISAPPTNAASVQLRTSAEPAHEVTWVPGEYHTFTRIDLASIQAKATSGDDNVITVNGGSS